MSERVEFGAVSERVKFVAVSDRVKFGAVSNREGVHRRALIFVHQPAWKSFDVEI